MAVLLTRPRTDSERVANELAGHGIATLIWPLTEIAPGPEPARIPDDAEAVILTSRHAAEALAAIASDHRTPVLTVGAATADAARAAGFRDVSAAQGDSTALIAAASRMPGTRIYYARGADISVDIAAALRPFGKQVAEQIVYSARPGGAPDPDVARALVAGQVDVVTLWSARNAGLLHERSAENPDWRLDRTDVLAISDKAAGNLDFSRFRRILVASKPNVDGMISAVIAAMRQKNS